MASSTRQISTSLTPKEVKGIKGHVPDESMQGTMFSSTTLIVADENYIAPVAVVAKPTDEFKTRDKLAKLQAALTHDPQNIDLKCKIRICQDHLESLEFHAALKEKDIPIARSVSPAL